MTVDDELEVFHNYFRDSKTPDHKNSNRDHDMLPQEKDQ